VRRDLDIAQQQLERAENYLARARQRAAPAVERHNQAAANQRDALDQLRNCDTIDLLDGAAPTVGEQRLHVRALMAWQHWAHGHAVPDGTLRTAFAVLARQPGAEQQLADALGKDLAATPTDRRSRDAGQVVDRAQRHAARIDFGVEL
jgi:hypothetical protein